MLMDSSDIPQKDRALVLQGGGSLGAYEAGAYKALYYWLVKKATLKRRVKSVFESSPEAPARPTQATRFIVQNMIPCRWFCWSARLDALRGDAKPARNSTTTNSLAASQSG